MPGSDESGTTPVAAPETALPRLLSELVELGREAWRISERERAVRAAITSLHEMIEESFVTDDQVVMTLPAPARTTDDTRAARRMPRVIRGPAGASAGASEERRATVARGPNQGGQAPEAARLQQVLEDVRFSLERGAWQAALATVEAALAPPVSGSR